MKKNKRSNKEIENLKIELNEEAIFKKSKVSVTEKCKSTEPERRKLRHQKEPKFLSKRLKENHDKKKLADPTIIYEEKKINTEKLDLAIQEKKIWNGFRKTIAWSTGFAENWWNKQSGTGSWKCSVGGKECKVKKLISDHSTLEIGHKHGFYTVMNEIDPVTVCDGLRHWEVYLVSDVIKKNEDEKNLEPQCKKCNRSKNQKKKDQRSGGFQPLDLGVCEAKVKCDETKIEELQKKEKDKI